MKEYIIQKYKSCWENHDLSQLEQLFHSDIVYQEKTDNIIRGIDALKNYWIENQNKQKRVSFECFKSTQCDNNIILYWKANFYHTIKSKEIYLEGIMWLEISNDKIVTLTEFFELR